MTRISYSEKLKDPRWQKKRLEIFSRDNFTCRDCQATDKTLHVHHCLYEKGDPWKTESRFLLSLCEDCHVTRQELENDARRALGIIFSRITTESECLHEFSESMRNAAENPKLFSPVIEEYGEVEYLAGGRWFSYAIDHPEFRSGYDEVTSSKVKWNNIDQQRKERQCHA